MANHGWVDTVREMTPAGLMEIFNELNQRLFKGNLTIEYTEKEDDAWGDHVWLLKYHSGGTLWATRVCWLDENTPKHFEMVHSGGSQFAFWLDAAILNEVAVKFGGLIGDDGGEENWEGVPGKYDDYPAYLRRCWGHNQHVEALVANELFFGPPEFKPEEVQNE